MGRFSDEKVKERCYFALIWPHLEYAASIRDPVQKDLIRELNKIQRKAVRFVKNCYGRTDSVTQMLNELGWEPLETRRLRARFRLLELLRIDICQSNKETIILEPHYITCEFVFPLNNDGLKYMLGVILLEHVLFMSKRQQVS